MPAIGFNANPRRRKPAVFTREGQYRKAYHRNRRYVKPTVRRTQAKRKRPYQTRLAPRRERAFRRWVRREQIPFNPKARIADYNMRGYFKRHGATRYSTGTHFPDTYKTPYDTTFSGEARVAKRHTPLVWRGNRLVNRRTKRVVFRPR